MLNSVLLIVEFTRIIDRMKLIKLFILITIALLQLEVVSGQSLSSVLAYRNSYGFRVKRNRVEQYSNIALCKENNNSVAFMGTKIVDSKSTKLVTINLLNGKMKHRQIVLPDSVIKQILDKNDAVQAIAMNGNIFAMALIQNVLIFKLDEAKQKIQLEKIYQMPSLISEIQMLETELVVFGSYPKFTEEIRNNYIATVDLIADKAQLKYTWLAEYSGSIYHILGGTKYLIIGDDHRAIVTDPRKWNQFVIGSNDTGIVINQLKSLGDLNVAANKIADSNYYKMLLKYHQHLIPMYDETMKLHEVANAPILQQIWKLNNKNTMLVVSTPVPNKGKFKTQYVVIDKNDSVLSVLSRDSFPLDYRYTLGDYRPYANLSYQVFDGEFAVFGRRTCQVDKLGFTQKEVYKKDGSKGKLYWAFDVYKWEK